MKNPYQVLDLDTDASEEEAKKAYREKAKKHHPDTGGDEEKFKEIQEAYDQIVSEDDDQFGFDFGAGFSTNFGGANKSVEDFIRDFEGFKQKGGFNTRGFSGDPFEKQQTRAITRVRIDFETAVNGGSITVPTQNGEVRVEVPAGVQSGQDFQINPQSVVRFEVVNNTDYWRKNKNDIYTEKNISVWDAMTGTDVKVETIDQKTVVLPIDPGTSDGELYRLKGEGGPKTFSNKPEGDFYVEVKVNIPKITDEDKIEKINQITDKN